MDKSIQDINKLIKDKQKVIRLMQDEIEDLESRLYLKNILKKLENVKHNIY